MLNFDCIYLGLPAQSSYVANSKIVNTLVLKAKDYFNMLEAFPDIKDQIEQMIDKKDQVWKSTKFQKAAIKNLQYKNRIKHSGTQLRIIEKRLTIINNEKISLQMSNTMFGVSAQT